MNKRSLLIPSSIAALSWMSPAHSQPVAPTHLTASAVEEIVVVGSNIRDSNLEQSLPVTVLSEQDLQAIAPSTAEDLERDVLMLEPGFNRDTAAALQALGHRIEWAYAFGSTQSIMIEGEYLYGASDPRHPDALTIGQ